jgi:hypothetical protein
LGSPVSQRSRRLSPTNLPSQRALSDSMVLRRQELSGSSVKSKEARPNSVRRETRRETCISDPPTQFALLSTTYWPAQNITYQVPVNVPTSTKHYLPGPRQLTDVHKTLLSSPTAHCRTLCKKPLSSPISQGASQPDQKIN